MPRAVSPRRPDPEDTIPPAWLKALLDEKDMEGARLARKLGLEPRTVYRWLNGQVPIVRVRWVAILATLGKPLDWQPPPSPPSPAEPPPSDPE
jgi:transcriptional regulator with XRE-family HTH domain